MRATLLLGAWRLREQARERQGTLAELSEETRGTIEASWWRIDLDPDAELHPEYCGLGLAAQLLTSGEAILRGVRPVWHNEAGLPEIPIALSACAAGSGNPRTKSSHC